VPVGGLLGNLSNNEWLALLQDFGLLFSLAGISLVVSLVPEDLLPVALGKAGGWKKWIKGFITGAVFFPVVTLVAAIVDMVIACSHPELRAPQAALVFLSQLDPSRLLFWVTIFFVVFVVSYVEEVLFRGFLQGFLGGLVHPVLAVLATAVAFSLLHYSVSQKASNCEIMAGLFVFSLLSSRMRAKEDSVTASIGMHAGFNAVALLFFFFLAR
jgi:membrane protease YdiL (CAAX protease family)